MRVTVGKSTAYGKVSAPPSKSETHRYLICSALANGKSTVSGITASDDVKATLDCVRSLGANVSVNGDTATVTRADVPFEGSMDCNESATSLRLMIPVCLLQGKPVSFCVGKRLFDRPLSVYSDCIKGVSIRKTAPGEITVCGELSGGEYYVPCDKSSQFVSGLMLALPLAKTDSIIHITGKPESLPYIRLTSEIQDKFSVKTVIDGNDIYIKSGQRYQSGVYTVSGDMSNTAFFDALNILGGDVEITGFSKRAPDGIYREYFEKIKSGHPTLDVSDCPDLAPVLMALGSVKNGVTLVGTQRLCYKESDRGRCMAAELEKFGIKTEITDNKITVGTGLTPPCEELYGHDDHRIVMALSVLCTVTGGVIDGCEAVKKSQPDFFDRLEKLNIDIK